MPLLKLDIEQLKSVAQTILNTVTKFPNIDNILPKDHIYRDVVIALLSGGAVAGVSLYIGMWRWNITNNRQQLTNYKEIIVENLVFDEAGIGTNQLLNGELNSEEKLSSKEKMKALKTLTSDALLKLDKKRQRELVKFLANLELLGGKNHERPYGKNPALLSGNLLKKINLEKAALNNADLIRSDLAGANLYKSSLQGANLQRANLSTAEIEGWELFFRPRRWFDPHQPTNLKGADLTGADLTYADLTGANLRKANLRGAKLKDIKLKGAKLDGAIYDKKTQLPEGQVLQGAYLIAPDEQLTKADLSNFDLSHADLTGADLTGADLIHANLSHANLTEAKVSDEVLEKATLCNTTWKDGSIKNPQEKCNDSNIDGIGEPLPLPGTSTTTTDEPTQPTATLRNFAQSSNRD